MSDRLGKLREQIDELDAKLVEVLNKRAELVLQVKETKKQENISVYSPVREKQILDRAAELAEGGHFPKDALRRIFLSVVSATRSLIGETKVGYLSYDGERAKQSALRQFGEETSFLSVSSFPELVKKLDKGELSYGVCLQDWGRSLSALAGTRVKIIAEGFTNTELVLATTGGPVSGIKRIYADAESFSYAETWVKQEFPGVERQLIDASFDLRLADADAALLAPKEVVSKTGLLIVSSSVQDTGKQPSRYLVLGCQELKPSGNDKTTVLLSLDDKSGALVRLLKVFSENQISLASIESFSTNDSEVSFLIDFYGHQNDASVKSALDSLTKESTSLNILGSYPREEA